MSKITAWSFTRWKDYEECPAKAKYKHVLKMKEPSSPAMERGSAIHKMCEDYINKVIDEVPMELHKFKESLVYLRGLGKDVGVEDSWTFKEDWSPTTWNDWASAWLRIKMDCHFTAEKGVLRVIDWKTGKFNEYDVGVYLLQLELYALGAFLTMPTVHTVIPKLAFLDQGVVYPIEEKVYKRTDLEKIRKVWLKRIAPMMNDTSFKPKPSKKCSWCSFSKAKGGPCVY